MTGDARIVSGFRTLTGALMVTVNGLAVGTIHLDRAGDRYDRHTVQLVWRPIERFTNPQEWPDFTVSVELRTEQAARYAETETDLIQVINDLNRGRF